MENIPNICRYFNANKGCWYGNNCRFLHIPDRKPACKFFISDNGCRFGNNCHFRHDEEKTSCQNDLKSEDNQSIGPTPLTVTEVKVNRNNNNMLFSTNSKIENKIKLATLLMDNSEKEEIDDNNMISCSACKWTLKCGLDESRKILREHYLERLLNKEGQHVKSVKRMTYLMSGNVYWCKKCEMSFEKSWSLFQHLADKSKPSKEGGEVAEAHQECLENIAGLLSGLDLGLIGIQKLQIDLTALICCSMCNLFNTFLLTKPGSLLKNKSIKSALKITTKKLETSKLKRILKDLFGYDDDNEDRWIYPGFTQNDVEELLCQGINPWDPEAHAALAVIYGYNEYL